MTEPRIRPRSIALITLFWLILQIGGLFTPGLLDDVDSVYLEIAREMLHRHDYVTPYIDGIRFFDKPPLMYWLAAGSMRILGEKDWAARIPLALAVLALLFAVYALARRLYPQPDQSDHAALYSSITLATSIGPYLYTRFYIPDILIALWMTLSVHLFLIALDRTNLSTNPSLSFRSAAEEPAFPSPVTAASRSLVPSPSSLIPCLLFAATLALNLLTKGLIGIVFPILFVLLYLLLTRQLKALPKLHPIPSLAVFAAIALPWHILAALRNPAIPMPQGLGLPQKAGWAWFYLYNEHFARFLGRRIPHDYGQTPVWLFWLYAAIWIMPWTTFLPAMISTYHHTLLSRVMAIKDDEPIPYNLALLKQLRTAYSALILWVLIVLGFFTLSSRQEYYSIPALPALALLVGGALALADGEIPIEFYPFAHIHTERLTHLARLRALQAHRYFLLPLSLLVALICTFYALTAPHPAPTSDLFTVLNQNTANYNLSLGHLFDLTGPAMGFFRLPLALTALGMLILGPASYLLRRTNPQAANLTLATGMTIVLLAAHQGLVRFNPILGSKPLAEAILQAQQSPRPDDLILIDGELTAGSTLLFYTRQPVHLVDGHINGPWFGSFWPDSPHIFETNQSLHTLWSTPRRLYLLTYHPEARTPDLTPYGAVHSIATAGGKTILTNH